MTVQGLILRFFLAYISLTGCAMLILVWLHAKGNYGVSEGVLFGCTLWFCGAFARANRRYFTGGETAAVTFGILGIDLCLQTLMASISRATSRYYSPPEALITAVFAFGVLHGIVICLTVCVVGALVARRFIDP